MPSTGRRSEELQKKLQRRNNSLKPSDFKKDPTTTRHVETKKDPVEKSKTALSDLRKRIDERKRASKLIDIQQYHERREEPIPELTRVTFSESPTSERQEVSPEDESSPQANGASMRDNVAMDDIALEKVPLRSSIENYYKDEDRYRNDFSADYEVPPSQIEVRSGETPDVEGEDDETEVSEITTDLRIMSTKGAIYAERRMSGNVQMRLARPSLSTPNDHHHLERDFNIEVSNLRQLGEAVEQAKMDLRKQMSPTNAIPRRYGLPYEETDYKPSADDDEIDSWGDAIRTDLKKPRSSINHAPLKEENAQFVAKQNAAKRLQNLVTEAYSYEGDVFIDATEVKEEDLDREENVSSGAGNHSNPIKIDDCSLGSSDFPEGDGPESKLNNKKESESGTREENSDITPKSFDENFESDELTSEDLKTKISGFTNNPASIASDIYNSSLGFLKSFSTQVDTQLKALQERGLISKKDMDGMLGILEHDVKETETKLSKDGDDAAIFLRHDLHAPVCGNGLHNPEQNSKKNTESKPETVENMLESLKKSYNLGISKCGIDSDLIKENTKAIEAIVVNLKKAKGSSPEVSDIDTSAVTMINKANKSLSKDMNDGNLLKELSAQGVQDMIKDLVPISTTKDSKRTFIVPVSMNMDK